MRPAVVPNGIVFSDGSSIADGFGDLTLNYAPDVDLGWQTYAVAIGLYIVLPVVVGGGLIYWLTRPARKVAGYRRRRSR